ncbi:MAG: hypothetical protein JWQ50_989 [Caballeronia mineralivorans]|nr:hypothetical protein [Caballeronia mineralivorans]
MQGHIVVRKHAVPCQDRLLLDRLDCHKAHRRLSRRNGNRLGISCIVLVSRSEWLDELGWNEPGGMGRLQNSEFKAL